LKIGVLLDEAEIIPGFDYTFYEVKPSSGRLNEPLAKAWNVVNCFADNSFSQMKPELVATSKGERAVRGTPKHFLWDWICPSRAEYRDYCLKVIRDVAGHDIAGIRLDSVCFPREGYCDCPTCMDMNRKSDMDLLEWRTGQIESFIRTARDQVRCPLGLTLEPDPCYGKERFGLDLERISDYVDFISTPLYMDYSIVYWLDIIANCFRRRTTKPYFIELYAGHPRAPTKYLVSALAVASEYADCIVLSTYEAEIARGLQQELVQPEVTRFFKERDCEKMLEIQDRWRQAK
jgi:hypothetical protein